MKNIFVTGGSGMVGKNLIEYLKNNNYNVLSPTSKELNLLNKNDIKKYIQNNNIDLIIHCAGIVGGIEANIQNPVKFLVHNLQMGLNIITSSLEANIKNFINLSSSCMYPKNIQNPLKEEYILNGKLEPTNEGYAIAKITSTKLCEYITQEDTSFQYKTIIPCNLYGKYDKFDPTLSHMIPAVIQKIHYAKINKIRSVNIWGDGLSRREVMYVEDLSDFIIYAINNINKMPQNINVGLGYDYSINEYYSFIAQTIGYSGQFLHDLTKPIGMSQKLVDISKLKKFGWIAKTSIDDGLKKTYNYYLNEVTK